MTMFAEWLKQIIMNNDMKLCQNFKMCKTLTVSLVRYISNNKINLDAVAYSLYPFNLQLVRKIKTNTCSRKVHQSTHSDMQLTPLLPNCRWPLRYYKSPHRNRTCTSLVLDGMCCKSPETNEYKQMF